MLQWMCSHKACCKISKEGNNKRPWNLLRKSQERKLRWYGLCDEKRGWLCRREGDGNRSTMDKDGLLPRSDYMEFGCRGIHNHTYTHARKHTHIFWNSKKWWQRSTRASVQDPMWKTDNKILTVVVDDGVFLDTVCYLQEIVRFFDGQLLANGRQ